MISSNRAPPGFFSVSFLESLMLLEHRDSPGPGCSAATQTGPRTAGRAPPRPRRQSSRTAPVQRRRIRTAEPSHPHPSGASCPHPPRQNSTRSSSLRRALQRDAAPLAGAELVHQHDGAALGVHLAAAHQQTALAADGLQQLVGAAVPASRRPACSAGPPDPDSCGAPRPAGPWPALPHPECSSLMEPIKARLEAVVLESNFFHSTPGISSRS